MKRKARILHSLISSAVISSLAVSASAAVTGAPTAIEIWDWYDLHAVRDNLSGHHRLMTDLDVTTAGYTELAGAAANEGQGWEPIGTRRDPFTGVFDGQGYEIRDLSADRPGQEGVGLFGFTDKGAVIKYVGVAQAVVTGDSSIGLLAGWNAGNMNNCYSTGVVIGDTSVGGLIGVVSVGTISACYSAANVSGEGAVGGLLGWNGGSVSNSYSMSSVSGNMSVGGLVGHNVGSPEGGTVSSSYSTGSVTGEQRVGGLIGYNLGGYHQELLLGHDYVGHGGQRRRNRQDKCGDEEPGHIRSGGLGHRGSRLWRSGLQLCLEYS